MKLSFLLIIIGISVITAKPVAKFDLAVETHCTFTFGNVQKLKTFCIQEALDQTKGMYLNLVRTSPQADGTTSREIIDRPSTHGNIYEESTAPTAS